jgi:hypothetical protein
MPKTYFCKVVNNFEICGETDPKVFEQGRYSTCRNCRNKKNKEIKEKNLSSQIEEKNNKIDPSCNLRYLIEDTILKVPIIDGYNISEKFKTDNEETSNILLLMQTTFTNMEKRIEYLEKYINLLELKIDTLKK